MDDGLGPERKRKTIEGALGSPSGVRAPSMFSHTQGDPKVVFPLLPHGNPAECCSTEKWSHHRRQHPAYRAATPGDKRWVIALT